MSDGRRGTPWLALAAIFLVALAPRLWFVTAVHPVGLDWTTDERSYAAGARAFLAHPLAPNDHFAFWPLGTSVLAAIGQLVTGNVAAVGVSNAVLSAAAVALGWDVARRATPARWVPVAVAVAGVVSWPMILTTGFFMTEAPFSFFVTAQLWFALRWVGEERRADAVGFGVVTALGLTVRPQLVLTALLTAVVLAPTRPRGVRWAAAPILLGLALTTAYLQYNSGSPGLVSQNGTFNLVFGRCHNHVLSWRTRRTHGQFVPVGLREIHLSERRAERAGERPWLALNPVRGGAIELASPPGDAGEALRIARDCVLATGLKGQLDYALVNVAMLWHGTSQFPSVNRWNALDRAWRSIDRTVFEVPFLLGLGWIGSRSPTRRLLAANGLAPVLTAALYFGELRMRLPYTMVIDALALVVVDALARAALGAVRSARHRVPSATSAGAHGATPSSL